jgi:hypothetical protein
LPSDPDNILPAAAFMGIDRFSPNSEHEGPEMRKPGSAAARKGSAMPIKKGERVVVSVSGSDVIAEAASDEKDGSLEIKYKKTFSTVNAKDARLLESWVLVDPTGKHLDTGGPIYADPKGGTTGDKNQAKVSPSKKAAEEFRDSHGNLSTFVPKKIA